MSGNNQIINNWGKVEGQEDQRTYNVFLAEDEDGSIYLINIEDNFNTNTKIGVATEAVPVAGGSLVLTNGLSGKGSDSSFVCNDWNYDKSKVLYGLGVDAAGEAVFKSLEEMQLDVKYQIFSGGEVGVIYLIDLPEEYQKETTTVKFSVGDGDCVDNTTALFSETNENNYTDPSTNKTYYAFRMPVRLPNIAKEITATLNVIDDSGVEKSIALKNKDIATIVQTGADPTKTADYEFRIALLNFGGYAKTYFGYSGSMPNIAPFNIKETDLPTVPQTGFSEKSVVKNDDQQTNFSYHASSLLLQSKTTLRHYFKVEDKDFSSYQLYLEDSDKALTIKQVGTTRFFYVDVPGIDPANYNNQYTITVMKGESKVLTLNYSVMNYLQRMANSDNSPDDIKNLCKAAYNYYDKYMAFSNT